MDRRPGSPPSSPRVAARERGDGRSSRLSDEDARLRALGAVEEAARAAGTRRVAGVDEAGRGALAGPVYAGAVILPAGVLLRGLDDSKALLPEVREALAPRIRARAEAWGVCSASAAEIDELGIAAASFLAMRRALARLAGGPPDLVLVDGFPIPGLDLPQRAVVKGDATVACISAASVLAKTARDAELRALDERHPWYGFAAHKGYGSAAHLEALRRHGPSPDHRLTFAGVLSRGRTASTVAVA
ncbi:MAG: ribonuclease HII [Thermoanaerobaculia bacterium]|jgi:ribonuclease HII|nr:ribonuclease HII [Thermoanaerobaculia bacterium]